MKRKITVLGCTGSMGTQALDVIGNMDGAEVVALTAHSNVDLLERQIRKFKPRLAVVYDPNTARKLAANVADLPTEILSGDEGVLAAASAGSDLVFNCVVGAAGLAPTLAAIRAGSDVALANKESLVIGGELVIPLAREKGVRIIPVDSEHSAIFQCLQGNSLSDVSRLILTASGGAFRGYSRSQLENVSAVNALKHPVWKMGPRITIDSATLMNKGFEVIEAAYLFDMPLNKIDIVIHPQGIIHSMVEYEDGAVMAQLGTPDMRLPIQYAINTPNRLPGLGERLDFTQISQLTFEQPNTELFPCLNLAKQAFAAGGTAPTVLNASDEEAVKLFLDGKIKFLDIPILIESALLAYTVKKISCLDEILLADAWCRAWVYDFVQSKMR
ncbi:MAG: 1-deoxy-D-xylulose-5-phosphate reductoisomerase [Defluviitaleaceae bacterium]|nr:1-deoxy-D-xylulose-5-phosphate reductoisomerase [Defluviitaleaceae bacterium]